MNHRIGRVVFASLIGLLVAGGAYRWITNPVDRAERVVQEAIVESSRSMLRQIVDSASLEIVDPLSPKRSIGKVYVYPDGENWAVSGYYRRNKQDRWHPFLMSLDSDAAMISLKAQDQNETLAGRAATDPRIELSR